MQNIPYCALVEHSIHLDNGLYQMFERSCIQDMSTAPSTEHEISLIEKDMEGAETNVPSSLPSQESNINEVDVGLPLVPNASSSSEGNSF